MQVNKTLKNVRCTEIPRIKEIPCYEISDLRNFKRSRKRNFFKEEMSPPPAGVKAQRDEGGGRILLGIKQAAGREVSMCWSLDFN